MELNDMGNIEIEIAARISETLKAINDTIPAIQSVITGISELDKDTDGGLAFQKYALIAHTFTKISVHSFEINAYLESTQGDFKQIICYFDLIHEIAISQHGGFRTIGYFINATNRKRKNPLKDLEIPGEFMINVHENIAEIDRDIISIRVRLDKYIRENNVPT